MGWFIAAFGLLALLSPMLASPAAETPQKGAAKQVEAVAADPQSFRPRRLETPATRITTCDVCAGLTCTTVRVRGRCTVAKAVAALRRREAVTGDAEKRLPGRLHHRERAVSKSDFRELSGALPKTGRARAKPKYGPQNPEEDGDAGVRLLDLYEKSGHPLSVRERRPLKLNAQPFRPLDLSEETADSDGGGSDEQGL